MRSLAQYLAHSDQQIRAYYYKMLGRHEGVRNEQDAVPVLQELSDAAGETR